MLFEYDITVPANTLKSTPKVGELEITRAVIRRIECAFPLGCRDMVQIQLFWGKHPIFPRNSESWVKGNGYVVSHECFYFIYQQPYKLNYKAHSEGTRYEHTITVRIHMMPIWAIYPFSDEMYRLATLEELGERV